MNLLLAAIAPVFVIIVFIYFRDKYEKEPFSLLFLSFILGAILSIAIVSVLYIITGQLLPITDSHSVWQQLIQAFVVVALAEEFSKYIIVYFFQDKKEFNEPFDGIVYAVMVSMGFACTENILYVYNSGFTTAILRAFTAVPAHATFGILMGYFMGKAKFSKNKIGLNILGLFIAVIFHGSYDFFLFIDFIPGMYIGAFVSLIIGLVLSFRAIKGHQENSSFKP